MKKDIEINEWIESYLNGNLPVAEEEEFRKRLGEDPDFAQTVELNRKLRGIITDGAYLHIKNELRSIHLQRMKKIRRVRRATGFGLGGLVVGVILFLLVRNVFVPDGPPVSKDLPVPLQVNPDINPGQKESEGLKSPENTRQVRPYESVAFGEQHADKIPEKTGEPAPGGNQEIPRDEKRQPEAVETGVEEPVQDDVNRDNSIVGDAEPPGKIDCRKIKIEGNFRESESCNNKATGSILIDEQSVTGGISPYTFSLSRVNFRDTLLFSGLYPGSYPLYVKDANDCVSRMGIALIRSVECTYQAVFAPLKGEIWTVPAEPDRDGTLNIFSKSGTLVYSFRITGGQVITWNGTTISGQALPMGIYQFEIRYPDGTVFMGNVTIVR